LRLYIGRHLASWADAATGPLAQVSICGIITNIARMIRNKVHMMC
jgi:hypothetical protein